MPKNHYCLGDLQQFAKQKSRNCMQRVIRNHVHKRVGAVLLALARLLRQYQQHPHTLLLRSQVVRSLLRSWRFLIQRPGLALLNWLSPLALALVLVTVGTSTTHVYALASGPVVNCTAAPLPAEVLGEEATYCVEGLPLDGLFDLLYVYPFYHPSARHSTQATISWWIPWPNNLVGRLGWYRQGLAEVNEYREFITALAGDELPSILLAAAIANQGNSIQRPFGWNGIELVQTWLGRRFEWQLSVWESARKQWEDFFERPSVGVGQIQPDEARRLTYFGDRVNLFDDRVSIGLMQAKMVAARNLFQDLELDATDLFALIAISNNDNSDGQAIFAIYQQYEGDLRHMLHNHEPFRRQLARMMTYVDYLHHENDWPLPPEVNVDHLWWLIQSTGSEE